MKRSMPTRRNRGWLALACTTIASALVSQAPAAELIWTGQGTTTPGIPTFGGLFDIDGNYIDSASSLWAINANWREEGVPNSQKIPGPGDVLLFDSNAPQNIQAVSRIDRTIDLLHFRTGRSSALLMVSEDDRFLRQLTLQSGEIRRDGPSQGEQNVLAVIRADNGLLLNVSGLGSLTLNGGVIAPSILKTGNGVVHLDDEVSFPLLGTQQIGVTSGELHTSLAAVNLQTLSVGDGDFNGTDGTFAIGGQYNTNNGVVPTLYRGGNFRVGADVIRTPSFPTLQAVNGNTVELRGVLRLGSFVARGDEHGGITRSAVLDGDSHHAGNSVSVGLLEPLNLGDSLTVTVLDGNTAGPDLQMNTHIRGWGDTVLPVLTLNGNGHTQFGRINGGSTATISSKINRIHVESGRVDFTPQSPQSFLADVIQVGTPGGTSPAVARIAPTDIDGYLHRGTDYDVYGNGTLQLDAEYRTAISQLRFYGPGTVTDLQDAGLEPTLGIGTVVNFSGPGTAVLDAQLDLINGFGGLEQTHTLDVAGSGTTPKIRLTRGTYNGRGTIDKIGTGGAAFEGQYGNLILRDGTNYIEASADNVTVLGGTTYLGAGGTPGTSFLTVGTLNQSTGTLPTVILNSDDPFSAQRTINFHSGTVLIDGVDATPNQIIGTGTAQKTLQSLNGGSIGGVDLITADGGPLTILGDFGPGGNRRFTTDNNGSILVRNSTFETGGVTINNGADVTFDNVYMPGVFRLPETASATVRNVQVGVLSTDNSTNLYVEGVISVDGTDPSNSGTSAFGTLHFADNSGFSFNGVQADSFYLGRARVLGDTTFYIADGKTTTVGDFTKSDVGQFTKTGGGTLVLSNGEAVSFADGINLAGGTLTTFGDADLDTTVDLNGGTLRLFGANTNSQVGLPTLTGGGDLLITAGGDNHSLILNRTTGHGHTGTVRVDRGIVRLQRVNTFSNQADVIIGESNPTATVRTGGFAQVFRSLSGNGVLQLADNGFSVTVNGGTFDGTINGRSLISVGPSSPATFSHFGDTGPGTAFLIGTGSTLNANATALDGERYLISDGTVNLFADAGQTHGFTGGFDGGTFNLRSNDAGSANAGAFRFDNSLTDLAALNVRDGVHVILSPDASPATLAGGLSLLDGQLTLEAPANEAALHIDGLFRVADGQLLTFVLSDSSNPAVIDADGGVLIGEPVLIDVGVASLLTGMDGLALIDLALAGSILPGETFELIDFSDMAYTSSAIGQANPTLANFALTDPTQGLLTINNGVLSVTVVPEPTAAGLCIIGLGALGLRRMRSKA